MKKLVIIGIICVMLCALTLVGCVESYNVDKISTDFGAASPITSNGGLAVKAGKYLFYINGYAGNDVDNVFGEVQKGAIARVEVNADGTLDMSTNQIVVPKNVYNTVATSGLYIDGEYIYYSTYSIKTNGDGEIKSDEMWLMRTKFDGTDTEIVKEFDDFTAQYKVANGYVIYYLEKELYEINLSKNKLKANKVDEDISAVLFTEYKENANDFTDAVFYTKAAESDEASHNVVWCYRAGKGTTKIIEGNKGDNGYQDLVYEGGYSITLKECYYAGQKARLIYTKTDSGTNTISSGTYSFDFDADLKFSSNYEVRYTYGTTLTSLNFLEDGSFLALNSTNVVWVAEENGKYVEKAVVIEASSAPTIMSVEEKDGVVRVYYVTSDNYIFAINVLKKVNGNYEVAVTAAESLYSGAYDTTWLKYDKVDGNVYFFNSDVNNYTYYVTLASLKSHNADSQVPTLLSLVTAEDEIAMMTESTDEE